MLGDLGKLIVLQGSRRKEGQEMGALESVKWKKMFWSAMGLQT